MLVAETDDAATSERRRGEKLGAEGRNNHRSGTDEHPEEVLSCHPRKKLLVSCKRRDVRKRPKSYEYDDGTSQMLQSSIPDQR